MQTVNDITNKTASGLRLHWQLIERQDRASSKKLERYHTVPHPIPALCTGAGLDEQTHTVSVTMFGGAHERRSFILKNTQTMC
jgi:hypothetical protein